ncbi:MAG: hypothetical protein NTZ05_15255 [Chloroflexi bacterium]|nr:hypothetical protein [Chloroflexota bacterium]
MLNRTSTASSSPSALRRPPPPGRQPLPRGTEGAAEWLAAMLTAVVVDAVNFGKAMRPPGARRPLAPTPIPPPPAVAPMLWPEAAAPYGLVAPLALPRETAWIVPDAALPPAVNWMAPAVELAAAPPAQAAPLAAGGAETEPPAVALPTENTQMGGAEQQPFATAVVTRPQVIVLASPFAGFNQVQQFLRRLERIPDIADVRPKRFSTGRLFVTLRADWLDTPAVADLLVRELAAYHPTLREVRGDTIELLLQDAASLGTVSGLPSHDGNDTSEHSSSGSDRPSLLRGA